MSIGIGIIGTGVMGADHARILSRMARGGHLSAVSDADTDRMTRVARDHGAGTTHDDPFELIANKDVQAVLIASPDETHRDLTLACIAAGKPVLCEKPLAPTSGECLEIVAAEVASGRKLVQVGFMRRFDPWYLAMRAGYREGRIGTACIVHESHRNAEVPPWLVGGMAITNSAGHDLDITRWLLDDEIAAIRVIGTRAGGRDGQGQPLVILCEMAGGTIVDIEVSLSVGYGYDILAEMVGETGTLTLGRPELIRTRGEGKLYADLAPDWRGRFEDAYRQQLNAWIAAMGRGEVAGATAWDGYVTAAVAEAGLAALKTGERVAVKLAPRPGG